MVGTVTPTRMRWAWLLVCLGCRGGESPSDLRTIVELPATPSTALDLLFVIDDSGGTAHLQQNLGDALPGFFEALGPRDLHVAVATSDLGTSASNGDIAPDIGGVGQGGCSGLGKAGNLTTGIAAITGSFLSDVALPDGTRQRNYDGELAQTVGQMVRVGSTGCGFEQPLSAMRAALEANPANAGFVRPDATLAVIVMMDEDDCSVRDTVLFGPDTADNPQQSFRCTRFGVTCLQGGNTPDEMTEPGLKDGCGPSVGESPLDAPSTFHDALVELKGDARRVVVGGIIGNPEPFEVELRATTPGGTAQPALAHSCTFAGPDGMSGTSDDQVADPGVRLQAFFDLFKDRSFAGSVCDDDLSSPLAGVADRIAFAMGSPCVTQAIDPATCVVEDVVGETITEIPPCPAPTCWSLVTDPATCPGFDHLALEVTRAAPPEAATITRLRCAID